MTSVSLERIAETLYPQEKPKYTTSYGIVTALNADGSMQVQLNTSANTTRCARLCNAVVGDVVLTEIMSNGQVAAIARAGGQAIIKLLWENSAPTSSFSSHWETLDVSQYDLLAIEVMNWNNSDFQQSSINLITATAGTKSVVSANGTQSNTPFVANRDVQIDAQQSEIGFGNGYWGWCGYSGYLQDNTYAIPQRIYGIKGVF